MPFRNPEEKLDYDRRYQQEKREKRAARRTARRNTPEAQAEKENKAKEKEAKKAATKIAANERDKKRKKDKRLLDRVQKKLDKHGFDINLKNIMWSNPVTPQGTPDRRIRASETISLTPQQRAGLRLLEDFMDAESETSKHEADVWLESQKSRHEKETEISKREAEAGLESQKNRREKEAEISKREAEVRLESQKNRRERTEAQIKMALPMIMGTNGADSDSKPAAKDSNENEEASVDTPRRRRSKYDKAPSNDDKAPWNDDESSVGSNSVGFLASGRPPRTPASQASSKSTRSRTGTNVARPKAPPSSRTTRSKKSKTTNKRAAEAAPETNKKLKSKGMTYQWEDIQDPNELTKYINSLPVGTEGIAHSVKNTFTLEAREVEALFITAGEMGLFDKGLLLSRSDKDPAGTKLPYIKIPTIQAFGKVLGFKHAFASLEGFQGAAFNHYHDKYCTEED